MDSVYQWIIEQRESEIAVSTVDVIEKARSIHPQFNNNSQGALFLLVYRYLKRYNLFIHTRTHVSRTSATAMESAGRDFAQRLMNSFIYHINDPSYRVKMDEKAVYMNCSPNRTIHKTEKKTVLIMIGGASSARFTLSVSVAMDGTKLPLFVIFKGKLGGTVEKKLPNTVPVGIVACVRKEAWMDGHTMRICYDRV